MTGDRLPGYAVFDDHVYSQRVAVVVRWFLLATWLALVNYRPDVDAAALWYLNGMGVALALLNGYIHWRIIRDRPISERYVIALSIFDLSIITAGIGLTSRFENTFFVFYYPALLGISLVFSSRTLSFTLVSLVALAYAATSLMLEPGVDFQLAEERTLLVRIATMFAVMAAGNLMTRIERTRRLQAVLAEREESQKNLELQRRAAQAQLEAQMERDRISREIHDGIAQSMYALSLNLETCAELAVREHGPLKERLESLVPLARSTLLETRQYIFDLKPLLSEKSDLSTVALSQVKEFQTVTGIPSRLEVEGDPNNVPLAVATAVYRILQESLGNVLKHAGADSVTATLKLAQDCVTLSIHDNGRGFDFDAVNTGERAGHGLANMRHRAEEIGGTFLLTSGRDEGTTVMVTLPTGEANKNDD